MENPCKEIAEKYDRENHQLCQVWSSLGSPCSGPVLQYAIRVSAEPDGRGVFTISNLVHVCTGHQLYFTDGAHRVTMERW